MEYQHFIIPNKIMDLDNYHQGLRKLLDEKLMGNFKSRHTNQS